MADDGDAMSAAPPTGTPSGGPISPPGVAAGNAAPGGPPPGQGPGILPPQGAGVPMPVRQLGAHGSGIDILRAVHKALKQAVGMLIPGSKEESTTIQCLQAIGKIVHTGEQGKEDAVDPMQRVQQAIQMRKMANQPSPGGPPPMAQPQPNTGPIPMAGAMR